MPTVQARTVPRAVEIVGGVEELAAQLELREELIRNWVEGQRPVLQEIFLRCVDIVNAISWTNSAGRSGTTPFRKAQPKSPKSGGSARPRSKTSAHQLSGFQSGPLRCATMSSAAIKTEVGTVSVPTI
jgi:hypothetical protein